MREPQRCLSDTPEINKFCNLKKERIRTKMNILPIWKKAANRRDLTTRTQSLLPVNPIGECELTDGDLETIYGAGGCGTSCPNENNSHDNNGNINVLSGNNVLSNTSVLDHSNLGIGLLGSGNSQTCYQKPGCC